jgi:hypothetical protein
LIPDELLADLRVLQERGYSAQPIEDGGKVFVVFAEFRLPSGAYNMETTSLLIYTTPLYPNAGFDMFWVDPELRLKGGAIPKGAEQVENYLNKSWRRFSYHPYNTKPWNPAEDSVMTFVAYIEQRLGKGD